VELTWQLQQNTVTKREKNGTLRNDFEILNNTIAVLNFKKPNSFCAVLKKLKIIIGYVIYRFISSTSARLNAIQVEQVSPGANENIKSPTMPV